MGKPRAWFVAIPTQTKWFKVLMMFNTATAAWSAKLDSTSLLCRRLWLWSAKLDSTSLLCRRL